MKNFYSFLFLSFITHLLLLVGSKNLRIDSKKVNFSENDVTHSSIKIKLRISKPKPKVFQKSSYKKISKKKKLSKKKSSQATDSVKQSYDAGQKNELAKYLQKVRFIISNHKVKSRIAQRLGLKGTVHLSFLIKKPNKVAELKVLRSSGHKLLDKSALLTLERIESLPPIPSKLTMEEIPIELDILYE